MASNLSMQPKDAAEISDMFFGASRQRARLDPAQSRRDAVAGFAREFRPSRAERAIETLEMAAFAADVENFTLELGETLILPWQIATQVVNDPGGEPLACAAKALDMPSAVFQRVLLFLKPEFGTSVHTVYRLSRLYDRLSERSALIMLAAWRGSTMAVTRAKYRPALYDDERIARARHPRRPAQRRNRGAAVAPRTGSQGARGQLSPRQIEKVPPCPVLGLDDPGIRIEPDFLRQVALPPRLPAPAAATSAAKIRSIGRLSS